MAKKHPPTAAEAFVEEYFASLVSARWEAAAGMILPAVLKQMRRGPEAMADAHRPELHASLPKDYEFPSLPQGLETPEELSRLSDLEVAARLLEHADDRTVNRRAMKRLQKRYPQYSDRIREALDPSKLPSWEIVGSIDLDPHHFVFFFDNPGWRETLGFGVTPETLPLTYDGERFQIAGDPTARGYIRSGALVLHDEDGTPIVLQPHGDL